MGTEKTAKGKNINMLEGNPIQLVMTFSVPLIFGNIFHSQHLFPLKSAVHTGLQAGPLNIPSHFISRIFAVLAIQDMAAHFSIRLRS